MAECVYQTLAASVFESAENDMNLVACQGIEALRSFLADFEQYLASQAAKGGELVEATPGSGMHFAVMHQNEDGSVTPVKIEDLPEEDQDRIKAEIAAQEAALIVQSKGNGGYL
jgi:hypothetical protein